MNLRKSDLTRLNTTLTPAESSGGQYRAVIAVNDDVGDGYPINLRDMDLETYLKNPVVLLAHDRWSGLPIGRTTSLNWTNRGLEAEFEFLPDDEMAARVRNAWDRGYLRAASIGARPKKDNAGQHELLEWSIVPVPADKDAVRSVCRALADNFLTTEVTMDEKQIRKIIEDAIKQRSGDDAGIDAKALASSLSGGLTEAIQAGIADAEEARKQAEKDFETRVQAAVEERMKKKMPDDKTKMPDDKKKADGDDDDDMKEKAEKQAEIRADLLVMVRGLLPENFETRGKTNHEILIAAAGDEIENAENRSEDYLFAKIEDIAARRAAAQEGTSPGSQNSPAPAQHRTSSIDVTRLRH